MAPFDTHNVQGDIVLGFTKKAESFVFFSITDSTAFRHALAAHTTEIITTTAQVQAHEAAIAEHKETKSPGLLPIIAVNVAFSSPGLDKLGVKGADLGDSLFAEGQEAQAVPHLSDPTEGGKLSTWELLFLGRQIDGVWLVGGPDQAAVDKQVENINRLFGKGMKVLEKKDGAVRPGTAAKHEHFGYLDGVSQPAIKDFGDPLPGQAVVSAGTILTGLLGDKFFGFGRPSWAREGSFLAFRKLQQLVPEFDDFTAGVAAGITGATPDVIGARMVGRWKSGASVDRNPLSDNVAEGADPERRNHFSYDDDQDGERCPYAAHVRKMNPRDGPPPFRHLVVLPRSVIRQGIPYGSEVTDKEKTSRKTTEDRGLLFVCYQSNLSNGFQFLQTTWANSPQFPLIFKEAGFDPIIGQSKDPQTFTMQGLDASKRKDPDTTLLKPFVVPAGGEYFFSPSITALKGKLGLVGGTA